MERRLHFRYNKIYSIDADGSDEVELTKNLSTIYGLAWSPDGTKFAFSMDTGRRIHNIYAMDADGKNLKPLTNHKRKNFRNDYPVWSPDGTKIAYVFSKLDRGPQSTIVIRFTIMVMDADGRNRTALANNRYASEEYIRSPDNCVQPPIWSPDGQKIMFVSSNQAHYQEINIIDINERNLERLRVSHYCNPAPCWLP